MFDPQQGLAADAAERKRLSDPSQRHLAGQASDALALALRREAGAAPDDSSQYNLIYICFARHVGMRKSSLVRKSKKDLLEMIIL
ncbi:hypothetical protein [Sphingomonas bisphenolicum]|uniref:Uncharacterized protein n=1 Tax=Sphingomonas bisphenolicum TaxID=296544 RepID=A0ABM7G3M9_9SPHN|nr:hypothetical protein [Sphingomonas bisphenolicum]BBF71859.1 hypothetical protein SBA_ch2_3920 [Sphingomonas bisphenolicum]